MCWSEKVDFTDFLKFSTHEMKAEKQEEQLCEQ